MAKNNSSPKWTPPIQGIIHWMGFPDSGKTTAAMSVPGVQPANILFFDFDGKSQPLANGFASSGRPMHYSNMLALCFQKKPAEIFTIFAAELTRQLAEAKAADNEPRTVIIDNFTPMEAALWEHFVANITRYSNHTEGQARSAQRGIVFPEFRRFYSAYVSDLLKIAPLVQIITHVKNQTVNGAKIPGVFEASAQVPMTTLPNARFWLLGSQMYHGAPVGLVLKRYTSMRVTDSGIQPVNVFPQKLSPCTWEQISYYVQNPVDRRELTPDEKVSDTETYLVGGEFTVDQKMAFQAAMEYAKLQPSERDADESMAALQPWAEEVKKLLGEGKSAPQIFQALVPTYADITIPLIVAAAQ